MYKTLCKRRSHKKVDNICQQGCDYLEARRRDQAKCEKETGCKYGEPFFIMEGIQFIAEGAEAPHVVIKFPDGTEMYCESGALHVLQNALLKGLKWCASGYAPGIC